MSDELDTIIAGRTEVDDFLGSGFVIDGTRYIGLVTTDGVERAWCPVDPRYMSREEMAEKILTSGRALIAEGRLR